MAAARAEYANGDYAAALKRLETLDAADPAPPETPLAIALVECLVALDRFEAADAHARGALARTERDGDLVGEGTLHRWLGLVAALQGRAEDARAHDWQALVLHESVGDAAELLLDRLSLAADEYPRSPELAYSIWVEAAETAAERGDTRHEVMALDGVLSVLLRWGEVGWAEWVLSQSRRARVAAGLGESTPVEVELYAADIAQIRGRHDEAVEIVREVLATHPAIEWDHFARTIGAASLGATGRWDAAAEVLEPAISRAEGPAPSGVIAGLDAIAVAAAAVARHRGRLEDSRRYAALARRFMGEAPETRARLMVEEAALALHDGDRPGAARHLERAVRTLESMRRTAAAGLATDFYSADMAESLETLVGLYGALGDAPNLQRIGELLKGVALAEQLEQDVLVRPESSGRLPSDRPARFEGSHHPLPGPLGLAALQAAVPAHAAMLDYYILPDGGFVLWVTRETARLFPLATPRVELVRAIDETMARLRTHRNTDADLTGLSKRLLEPVAGVLAAAAPDLLLIAPHGVLHMFPFEALPFGPGRLIDATAVAYLPTPGALRWQRGASSRHPAGKVLVLGDPTSDLPEARGEAQDVGKYLGVEPLVGAAADRGAVAGAGALSVLHIASHGHQSWTRDGAWLALADGRFGPREIRMLSLPGALVVLSACESGIAPVSAGDEMPEALDRSFLAAGAETVVSTRWQVSDRVTRDLMSRFYARIGAADHPQPAQAWAEAVRTHRAQIGTLAQNALGATRGISPASSPLGASPDRLEHWAAFKVVVAPRSSAFP